MSISSARRTLTDIGGKQQGTRLSLGAEARYPVSDTIALSAGPSVTWADAKYTQTFFGVDAAQSARSGLAVRTANAGLNSVGFSVGALWIIPGLAVMLLSLVANLGGDGLRTLMAGRR